VAWRAKFLKNSVFWATIHMKYIFPTGGLLKSSPNPFANVVEKRGTGCIHNAFKVGETKW
jgi:hypothetical protein